QPPQLRDDERARIKSLSADLPALWNAPATTAADVVASTHPHAWRKQLNLLTGYLYFYNPLRLAGILLRRKTKVSHKAAGMQVVGMLGVIQTARRTAGWAVRLMFGKIERLSGPPMSPIPMRSLDGAAPSHAPMDFDAHTGNRR